MNEFNIIEYLNDINLKDILGFIKLHNQKNLVLDSYFFQAKDQEDNFVSGFVNIFGYKIEINYKTSDNNTHLFSSMIIATNNNDYSVFSTHSLLENNKTKLLEEKWEKNIAKKNIFKCFKKNPKILKKTIK